MTGYAIASLKGSSVSDIPLKIDAGVDMSKARMKYAADMAKVQAQRAAKTFEGNRE